MVDEASGRLLLLLLTPLLCAQAEARARRAAAVTPLELLPAAGPSNPSIALLFRFISWMWLRRSDEDEEDGCRGAACGGGGGSGGVVAILAGGAGCFEEEEGGGGAVAVSNGGSGDDTTSDAVVDGPAMALTPVLLASEAIVLRSRMLRGKTGKTGLSGR